MKATIPFPVDGYAEARRLRDNMINAGVCNPHRSDQIDLVNDNGTINVVVATGSVGAMVDHLRNLGFL